jgi:hypothetical protein
VSNFVPQYGKLACKLNLKRVSSIVAHQYLHSQLLS